MNTLLPKSAEFREAEYQLGRMWARTLLQMEHEKNEKERINEFTSLPHKNKEKLPKNSPTIPTSSVRPRRIRRVHAADVDQNFNKMR